MRSRRSRAVVVGSCGDRGATGVNGPGRSPPRAAHHRNARRTDEQLLTRAAAATPDPIDDLRVHWRLRGSLPRPVEKATGFLLRKDQQLPTCRFVMNQPRVRRSDRGASAAPRPIRMRPGRAPAARSRQSAARPAASSRWPRLTPRRPRREEHPQDRRSRRMPPAGLHAVPSAAGPPRPCLRASDGGRNPR